MFDHSMKNDAADNYMDLLVDASRISQEVAMNGPSPQLRAVLEARCRITLAAKLQADAISNEAIAMLKFYDGHVDAFVARHNGANKSFAESIQHANAWSAHAGASPLFDSYQSAFNKIASRDTAFANRNPGGLFGLVAGIKAFVRASKEIIDRVSATVKSTADAVRNKFISASDAVPALMNRIVQAKRSADAYVDEGACAAIATVKVIAEDTKSALRSFRQEVQEQKLKEIQSMHPLRQKM